MKIGVIVANEDEFMAVIDIMKEAEEERIFDLKCVKGKISGKTCILVKGGVGKVNSARTTQILVDIFKVTHIINVGSAGGVNTELNIGDIVIGEKLLQYDFDLSGIDDCEKGEIDGIGKYVFSDKMLISACKDAIEELKEVNCKVGIIASADKFQDNPEESMKVREEFGADCVEMEGASVAQVCYLDGIPFLVIRGISDVVNGKNKIDFLEYSKLAAKRASDVLKKLISKM